MDHAGSIWITAFNEVAEQLMGISANDLHKLKVSLAFLCGTRLISQDEGDEAAVTKYFGGAAGKTFSFQMMAKQDSYNVSCRQHREFAS